jgi:hypothetical protein
MRTPMQFEAGDAEGAVYKLQHLECEVRAGAAMVVAMGKTMTIRKPRKVRACAILAYLVCGLVCVTWSAHARADEETKLAADKPVELMTEHVVRLPERKLGGIRSGHVLLITDRGAESIRPALLALRPLNKPNPFKDFCSVH